MADAYGKQCDRCGRIAHGQGVAATGYVNIIVARYADGVRHSAQGRVAVDLCGPCGEGLARSLVKIVEGHLATRDEQAVKP